MGDRDLLGPADVSDETLTAIVGDSLGTEVELISCDVEVAAYALESLTTAGRYWVRGTARHSAGVSPYTLFVKVVQSWSRTVHFQVPEELRELALRSLPWFVEPRVYRSRLGECLPPGLSMPRAHAVIDLDEESASLWLQAVDVDPTDWSPATFRRAAHLLGRLAASPAVRQVGTLGVKGIVRDYANGRVAYQLLPALRSEELWRHPVISEAFTPELRTRLLAAAETLPGVLDELDGAPLGSAHGDACPLNLLIANGAPDDFVMIDFGRWCEAPLGFDLSQLLLGEVQLGHRPASELVELEDICLRAYVDGLHAEGCEISLEAVRRTHALLMLLFWGMSAVPMEVLTGPTTPVSAAAVRERARAAAFVLDLVDATSATPPERGPAAPHDELLRMTTGAFSTHSPERDRPDGFPASTRASD